MARERNGTRSRKAAEQPAADPASPFEKVDPPIRVGAISVPDANEIRTRNELIVSQTKRLEELQREYQTADRLRKIVDSERNQFLLRLIERAGLDARSQYQVDPDSGSILLVARYVEQEPAVAETEAVAVAAGE